MMDLWHMNLLAREVRDCGEYLFQSQGTIMMTIQYSGVTSSRQNIKITFLALLLAVQLR